MKSAQESECCCKGGGGGTWKRVCGTIREGAGVRLTGEEEVLRWAAGLRAMEEAVGLAMFGKGKEQIESG